MCRLPHRKGRLSAQAPQAWWGEQTWAGDDEVGLGTRTGALRVLGQQHAPAVCWPWSKRYHLGGEGVVPKPNKECPREEQVVEGTISILATFSLERRDCRRRQSPEPADSCSAARKPALCCSSVSRRQDGVGLPGTFATKACVFELVLSAARTRSRQHQLPAWTWELSPPPEQGPLLPPPSMCRLCKQRSLRGMRHFHQEIHGNSS